MGLIMSRVYDKLFTRDTRVLMIGLDGAGKTTMLYKLKLDEVVQTIPTIGFNVEQVQFRNLNMTIWDVGGQDKIRTLWKHYFNSSDAVVFIVDSNDRERLQEAADALHGVLSNDELSNAVVLVYANKIDLPSALSPSSVAEGLKLNALRHKWYIVPASATTGRGVFEGLEWLSTQLKSMPSKGGHR